MFPPKVADPAEYVTGVVVRPLVPKDGAATLGAEKDGALTLGAEKDGTLMPGAEKDGAATPYSAGTPRVGIDVDGALTVYDPSVGIFALCILDPPLNDPNVGAEYKGTL